MLYVKDCNLAFRHIPKNAGKAIRRSLEKAATISHTALAHDLRINEAEAERLLVGNVVLPGYGLVQLEHLPLEAMRAHFPHSFEVLRNARSFVLAREPRDRFFSALLQRLGEYKDIKGLRADDPRVLDEAQRVCERLSRDEGQLELEFTHFVRQVDFTHLDGMQIIEKVFPMEQMAEAAFWIEATVGLKISVVREHLRREPKKWSRSIQPAARYIGRQLIPRPIKRAIYPLWMKSGVFANAANRYSTIELGPDVESFVTEYYARDAALYHEACKANGQFDEAA